MKPLRIALLYFQSEQNATLSYQHGWPAALMAHAVFTCHPLNLAHAGWTERFGLLRLLSGRDVDAIVLLHSTFSNQRELRGLLYWLLPFCRQPKIYFIGNEYKSMPQKMRFCQQLGIDLLVSQSTDARVLRLYRERLGCKAVGIPNTGFDPSVFRDMVPLGQRDVDIGYRAYDAPWYLGNDEKREIAAFFLAEAERLGLRLDISMDPAERFDMPGYAAFLNRCRGQIGTESGGDYFELTDATRDRVLAYMKANPGATWPDIKARFFSQGGPSVPMRIISGRQVEAAACGTVQILFEGGYGGFLRPDEHYIPLAKDFSNIDEAMRKFRDNAFCARLAANARDVALLELTYERLGDRLATAIATIH